MIITTAIGPRLVVAHHTVGPAAAAGRAGAAPVAPRRQGTDDRPARRHRPRGRRGRASGVPARDHAAALPGRHPGGAESRRFRRGISSMGRRSHWRRRPRPRTASSCTPRSTSAPPPTTGSASTPRSWCRPRVSWWRAPASCTSRSPPAITRTPTFRAGPADDNPYPVLRARRSRRPHRDADLLGRMVPRSRPQLFDRRRRNRRLPNGDRVRAEVPRIRYAAPVAAGDRGQRHQQRAVHGGAEPDGRRGQPVRSTARRSSPTRTAACWCRRRATRRPCWWPTSTWISGVTGWSSSRSC